MYRKIYECQVKMWQSDATGKRALKWITMPVEKARQRADVAVRCFECCGVQGREQSFPPLCCFK
jgi:hypothetical protein